MKRQYVIVHVVIVLILFFFGGLSIYGAISGNFERETVAMIGGIIFIALGLFFIHRILTLDYLIMIKDYLNKHPQITMNEIENEFNGAIKTGTRVWVGKRWTFYMDEGSLPNLLDNYEIVWAFFDREDHGKTRTGYIYNYNSQQQLIKVPISKKNSKKVLRMYDENYAHIVTGYNKDLYNKYFNDYNNFLNLRYRSSKK